MAGGSRDQRRAVPSPAIGRQYLEDESVPDLYADEFWFASGPISGTLTLLVTIPGAPGDPAGTVPAGRIVGRVRMSPQLAVELAKLINNQLAGQIQVISTDPAAGGPKH